MSRPLRNLWPASRRTGRTLLPLVAALGLAAHGARAETDDEEACGPFEREPVAPVVVMAESGVVSSGGGAGGEIVELPRGSGPPPSPTAGEALIALPKGPDGTVPTNFRLAPGATVAESFFSPVICATVVRVIGPRAAAPESLVASVPDTGLVVPNHLYSTAATEPRPVETGPDPYRSLQYGLDRAGVEPARPIANGGGVRVALLDSAPHAQHRDLARVSIAALPDGPPDAPAVHGSLMAGVINAIEGNAYGIAGLSPGVDLLAIPVCVPVGATGSDHCRLYDLLRGADRAWEEKAQVVSLALVGPPNALLRRAMARLDRLGVLLVAAAGNEGVDDPRYPAAYPSVIGVGAVDRRGARFARGNRGASAEILAPGVEIISTVPGDSFAIVDGTSLAAAHVAGALALALGGGAESQDARTALFQAAEARVETPGATPLLPPICDVLQRLGTPCP